MAAWTFHECEGCGRPGKVKAGTKRRECSQCGSTRLRSIEKKDYDELRLAGTPTQSVSPAGALPPEVESEVAALRAETAVLKAELEKARTHNQLLEQRGRDPGTVEARTAQHDEELAALRQELTATGAQLHVLTDFVGSLPSYAHTAGNCAECGGPATVTYQCSQGHRSHPRPRAALLVRGRSPGAL